jgi:hypothetical protein
MLSPAPAWEEHNFQEEKQVEIKYIQSAISIAVIAFLILCIAITPIREWFFGPPAIDDSKGFPWARNKHQ